MILPMMGSSSSPDKLSANKERVAKELVQGQEFATQLQILLKKPYGENCFLTTEAHQYELLLKILASFTQALSLVTTCDSVEVCQNLAASPADSVCCDDRRSENSGESRRKPTANRRGCYRRKNTSLSWTTVSAAIGDAHTWRKYGQKEILNAKYPRSYFRCIHKYDRGCKATKQVQKVEEDPQMYCTTYIGHHTCSDILKYPQTITTVSDNNPWEPSYMVIASDSKNIPTGVLDHHHHPTKQEYKAETPSDLTDNLPSLDSIMWKDFVALESTEAANLRSDYTAASSMEATCQSLDMDFVVKSIDFDNDFRFDESGIF
eukprot:XP_002520871.2 probable WRKY transcription factor 70 [Ricinus communis]